MDLIHKYFPELTQEQINRFKLLTELYTYWNQRINVISRKDIPHLYERHVLHSLAIAKFIRFGPGSAIADIGTGGGFPGIPLAITFPGTHFILIDSIEKKIKVVNDISQQLGLTNIQTIVARAENLKLSCDYIVSRAVSPLDEFLKNTIHILNKKQVRAGTGGLIYLKGGDFEDELKKIAGGITVKNINVYFAEEFFETKKIVFLEPII